MGNHCSLVFTGESSFQGFLGGAGFCPSTLWLHIGVDEHPFASYFSLAQSRPFDLLVFPLWFIFSKGPKRLTFDLEVFWASEILMFTRGTILTTTAISVGMN